jgi:hypothetical protein
LGLTGEIIDLVPLGAVAENCGDGTFEMSASQAASNIKLRAAVQFALSRFDEAKKQELGISKTGLTTTQFAHRLKFLMDELGLAIALSMLPSMQMFGQCAYSPIDWPIKLRELRQLTTEGLGKELRFSPDFIIYSNSSDHEGHISARESLLSLGFISRVVGKVPLVYILTEKGENLIRAVLGEIGRSEFRETQEELPGGPKPILNAPRT